MNNNFNYINTRKHVNNNSIYILINNIIDKYEYHTNRVLACVFKGSKIYSFGKSKCSINVSNIRYSTHAEINAINNYFNKFSRKDRDKHGIINILVIRQTFDGNLQLSRCCKFCLKSIHKSLNINKIFYTDNDKVYSENLNSMILNINEAHVSSGDKRSFKKNILKE